MLYRYNCPEHGEFEAFNTIDNRHNMFCPICDLDAEYMIAAPRIKLEGITGHFPTAADKWATLHEKEAKREPR